MGDYSYLMKGIGSVETDSSVLVSSSRYLNDARVRDWVATHLLRRNGADVPTPSDSIQLVEILRIKFQRRMARSLNWSIVLAARSTWIATFRLLNFRNAVCDVIHYVKP